MQQLNQPDTGIKDDKINLEKTRMIPLTTKNYHQIKSLDLKFQFLLHLSFM